MQDWMITAAAAAAGAAAQEVLWWFQLRRRLDDPELQTLRKSIGYWVAVAAFILVSGAMAVCWFGDGMNHSKDALIFGASLPLILKQIARTGPSGRMGGDRTISRYINA